MGEEAWGGGGPGGLPAGALREGGSEMSPPQHASPLPHRCRNHPSQTLWGRIQSYAPLPPVFPQNCAYNMLYTRISLMQALGQVGLGVRKGRRGGGGWGGWGGPQLLSDCNL